MLHPLAALAKAGRAILLATATPAVNQVTCQVSGDMVQGSGMNPNFANTARPSADSSRARNCAPPAGFFPPSTSATGYVILGAASAGRGAHARATKTIISLVCIVNLRSCGVELRDSAQR